MEARGQRTSLRGGLISAFAFAVAAGATFGSLLIVTEVRHVALVFFGMLALAAVIVFLEPALARLRGNPRGQRRTEDWLPGLVGGLVGAALFFLIAY